MKDISPEVDIENSIQLFRVITHSNLGYKQIDEKVYTKEVIGSLVKIALEQDIDGKRLFEKYRIYRNFKTGKNDLFRKYGGDLYEQFIFRYEI